MSQERYDLVVRGGTLVTPSGRERLDLGIREGRIVALGVPAGADAAETLDARGLHVLPGVIDTQVHFREPGLEHKEDLETGAAAAALGGVTAVFEMPNTDPPTISAKALADKLERAAGRMRTDHAFFVGASPDNIEELPTLERLPGAAGVKVFMGSSTGSLLVEDDETLLEVLKAGRRRFAVHAEDEPRLVRRRGLAETGHPESHPLWRDPEAARLATERVLGLARRAGRPLHLLHVSTADELPILALNRDIATVETTPNHLTLEAPECYERLGSKAQMNPPVREAHHREALWAAIASGLIDVIGSDHAPHTAEEKARDYPATPSGMPGVQTLLPLMLDHMAAGRLSLERLVDLTAHGPARIYGIADKGRIAEGYDADLVLVDLQARWTIESAWLASKCGWSPYEGMRIRGRPVATLLRGLTIARDGELVGEPAGRPVRFWSTLEPEAG